MHHITLRAHAKINLALDVIDKRDDGYHNIKSVMQSVWLHDKITMSRIDKPKLKLFCNSPNIPTDGRNIIIKAAELLIKNYDIKGGVFIDLAKRIPVAAGLGGGSSDCAATIIGLRKLFSLPISNKEMFEIGLSLGADVPFCLLRGTAMAEGVGEMLTPLKSGRIKAFVVLVRPPVYVSTKDIFKAFSLETDIKKTDFDGMINSIKTRDAQGIASRLNNSLEHVTTKKYPIISDIKSSLITHGATGSLMSGSGPTVFGIFNNKQKAVTAMRKIQAQNPKIREIFLTTFFTPTNRD